MTEEHLRTALAALSSEPPDYRAALDALEAAGHRWAIRAIERGPKDVAPIIKAIEYDLDRTGVAR